MAPTAPRHGLPELPPQPVYAEVMAELHRILTILDGRVRR
jgi:hypothetical protein